AVAHRPTPAAGAIALSAVPGRAAACGWADAARAGPGDAAHRDSAAHPDSVGAPTRRRAATVGRRRAAHPGAAGRPGGATLGRVDADAAGSGGPTAGRPPRGGVRATGATRRPSARADGRAGRPGPTPAPCSAFGRPAAGCPLTGPDSGPAGGCRGAGGTA